MFRWRMVLEGREWKLLIGVSRIDAWKAKGRALRAAINGDFFSLFFFLFFASLRVFYKRNWLHSRLAFPLNNEAYKLSSLALLLLILPPNRNLSIFAIFVLPFTRESSEEFNSVIQIFLPCSSLFEHALGPSKSRPSVTIHLSPQTC